MFLIYLEAIAFFFAVLEAIASRKTVFLGAVSAEWSLEFPVEFPVGVLWTPCTQLFSGARLRP